MPGQDIFQSSSALQVTKVRVHLLVGNTYHARVHFAPSPAMRAAGVTAGEVDVDARPSDAINLAVRFKAPLYISKEVRGPASLAPMCVMHDWQLEPSALSGYH